jgi:phage terminase large subunit-like protein
VGHASVHHAKGNPRVLVTTTPRPIPIIKDIMSKKQRS